MAKKKTTRSTSSGQAAVKPVLSKAEKETPKEYIVLIPLTNGETGKDYSPGDVVKDGDFPPAVIDNWLGIEPPVLEVRD